MSAAMSLEAAARALGGVVSGGQILCPGPGHSAGDKSLSVRFVDDAPDGFLVTSFATDDPLAAKDYVRERLGLPAFGGSKDVKSALAGLRSRVANREDGWTMATPKADPGRSDVAPLTPAGCTLSKAWRYLDDNGALLYCVARFDKPEGGKEIRPLTYWTGPNGRSEWRAKSPDAPRPLYGLDRLAARPDAPVLVVEGEKAADAAATRFADYVVVTSSGGANAAAKSAWGPLAGRAITIWPDNDTPGERYAADVVRLLDEAQAKSVRIVKLPSGLPVAWDLADDLPDGVFEADIMVALEDAAASAPVDPWSAPDVALLGTGRRPAPPFPTVLLGSFWAAWAERRAASASAPVDYVSASLLAAVGATLANVRRPKAGAAWSEPPLLWVGLVGNPSSGKSPALDAAGDLIGHAEGRMAEGFPETHRAYESDREAAKARRAEWEAAVKAAVSAGDTPPMLTDDAVPPVEPVRPRIRVADATTERLATLSAGLPRGLLLSRDELAGWFAGFDRYGGGGSDRAFMLEGYGGRPYVVDRVKHPDPIHIRHLAIGVLGGTQPDKLSDIFDSPDDGLTARFLWTWPDGAPGFNLARDVADDSAAQAAFARVAVLPMATDENGEFAPAIVPLTREAEDILETFAREMAARTHEASGMFAGALGKARGHVLRLAAVLEHLWWSAAPGAPEPRSITPKAVRAAAGLVDGYFVPMTERVLGDAALPQAERQAIALARHLRAKRIAKFNARDLRREIGGPLREAEAMERACVTLIESGLIRPEFARAGETKGRTAKNYETNPLVWEVGR